MGKEVNEGGNLPICQDQTLMKAYVSVRIKLHITHIYNTD